MVAGWFGVTLPFAAYTSAARLAAFLAGPWGWAIIAVALAAEALLQREAAFKKTLAFVMQVHCLRLAAVQDAHIPEGRVFTPTVCFPGGGRLEANREQIGEWEEFELLDNRDGTHALLTYTGYVCAEDGGGGVAVANRDHVGGWEKWTRVDNGNGTYSFRSHAGLYLCADEVSGVVTADREAVGPWEQFRLEQRPGGRKVGIKCSNDSYLSSQS